MRPWQLANTPPGRWAVAKVIQLGEALASWLTEFFFGKRYLTSNYWNGQDLHHLIWLYWNFFVWKVCVHLLHHSMVARQLQPSVVTMAQLVESLGTALRWAQALQTFEETGCVSLVHAVSLGESMWRTYFWWKTTDKQMPFVSGSVPDLQVVEVGQAISMVSSRKWRANFIAWNDRELLIPVPVWSSCSGIFQPIVKHSESNW